MRMNSYMVYGTYTYIFGSSDFIHIFSGQMPEVDENFVFNSSNFIDNRLTTFNLSNQLQVNPISVLGLTSTPASISATAAKTGIATWFALIDSGYPDCAIIGTLTDNVENNDVLLLETVNVVQGQPVIIIDFRISMAGEV